MLSGQDLVLFIGITLLINFTPGPSIAYVLSVVAGNGLKAGIVATFGLALGILCHVVAAACGVSALLITSDLAFSLLKLAGAVYLIFLGIKILLTKATSPRADPGVASANWKLPRIFTQGVLVDLLNPKIGLFFLAFLPQFVNLETDRTFVVTLMLGLLFVIIGTLVNIGIATITSRVIGQFGGRTRIWLQRWVPGAALIGLGTRLAFADR